RRRSPRRATAGARAGEVPPRPAGSGDPPTPAGWGPRCRPVAAGPRGGDPRTTSLSDLLSQPGEAPMDEGLDRAFAAAQDRRDFVAGQVGIEPQDKGGPLALGQGGEDVQELVGPQLRLPSGRRPEMVPLPALATHQGPAAVDHRPVEVARRVVDGVEAGLEAKKAILDDLLCQMLGAK